MSAADLSQGNISGITVIVSDRKKTFAGQRSKEKKGKKSFLALFKAPTSLENVPSGENIC